MKRTPFETASVAPRRHAACWACVCDRAALTKPCGNTRGAAERREERRNATDGQTARQPGRTRERANEK